MLNTYNSLCIGLFLSFLVSCAGQAPEEERPLHTESAALHARPGPVGLSVFFRNGVAQPITLVGRAPRYLQELDISEQITTSSDQGLMPLMTAASTASLNWDGVELAEEIWVPNLDGTFTRERYYRNAKWMERRSSFRVTAHNSRGRRIGRVLKFRAGKDNRWRYSDDGFVRRFNARQRAVGCAAPDDCSGASFTAEVLVQVRSATRPRRRARRIPMAATELRIFWSAQPDQVRSVAVDHRSRRSAPYGYGFVAKLEPLGVPPNGEYYAAGDTVTLRLTFRDGAGKRLHPAGSLPSYADVLAGENTSGLSYLDPVLPTRLYYALKHRESSLMVGLSGPLDQLKTAETVVDPLTFFQPQTQFAFAEVDGYSAVIQTVPAAAIIFGGFETPSLWATPVSDEVQFTIPSDALPGTYTAVVKARRVYGGEALQRGATARIQVGQVEPSHYVAKTRCNTCHSARGAGLDETLHGIGDRTTCFSCHSSLAIEFDNALDIRVHRVHSLSDRYPLDINYCSSCHLTPPSGEARGL